MLSNDEQVDCTITYALLLGGELEEIHDGHAGPGVSWRCGVPAAKNFRYGGTKYLAAVRHLEQVSGYYLHTNGTLMKHATKP
jgi:hypothetical protein